MGVLVVETLQNRIVAIIVYYYCLFNCQLKYHFFKVLKKSAGHKISQVMKDVEHMETDN